MASSSSNGLEDVFFEHPAGGNRCESERQVAWKGLEVAHNGVRGDVAVEVREPRQVGNGITNWTRRTA